MLMGAYAARKYFQPRPQPAPEKQETAFIQNVPLAVVDIPAGRTIAQADVTTVPLNEAQILRVKLHQPWMGKASEIIGRTLRQPVKQGQTFTPADFYPVGIGPDIAAKLKPGERAVSIAHEGGAAPAGLITPGAVVDVLFRGALDAKRKSPEASVTLISGVRVLAVGQNTLDGMTGEAAGPLTLAVNETQARALEVVEGHGTLTLVLRNGKDAAPAQRLPPTTLPELFGYQPPEPFSTQIYRRGRLSTAIFQDGRQQSVVTEPPYDMPVTKPAQPPAADDKDS
jgi:pilus assembly protein CpaB